MFIALGLVVALFLALLVVGAVTGRVKVQSCCAIADPRQDLRMRAAFLDGPPVDTHGRPDVETETGRI